MARHRNRRTLQDGVQKSSVEASGEIKLYIKNHFIFKRRFTGRNNRKSIIHEWEEIYGLSDKNYSITIIPFI